MKQSHDVGGELDAPAIFEEKEEEHWELNTFVDYEVLGWRGIGTSLVNRPNPHGKAVNHSERW
jgi:hypothetical protein